MQNQPVTNPSAHNAADSIQQLQVCLATLSPKSVKITDKSEAHRGHVGALSGGHFHVEIVCAKFAGLSPLQRHRLVYDTLGNLSAMGIHALSLKTKTPAEVEVN